MESKCKLPFSQLSIFDFRFSISVMVGRRGFEPLKSKDSGFTVRPIWPLWNLPNLLRATCRDRTNDLLITNQLLYQLS